jgi:DNA-directed RNA polymerase subunit RPC12/RpoP
MEHEQKVFECNICHRQLIVDILFYGTSHQEIKAITCKECSPIKDFKDNIKKYEY